MHRNVLVNYLRHKKNKGQKGGDDEEEELDEDGKYNFRKNRESNFVKDRKEKEKKEFKSN